MAKKSRPTGSNQRAGKQTSNKTINYNPLNVVSKRPAKISLTNQQATLISMLKVNRVTTFDAREVGIMNPSTRIGELRKKGAVIDTHYHEIAKDGKLHPGIAVYTLIGWLREEVVE